MGNLGSVKQISQTDIMLCFVKILKFRLRKGEPKVAYSPCAPSLGQYTETNRTTWPETYRLCGQKPNNVADWSCRQPDWSFLKNVSQVDGFTGFNPMIEGPNRFFGTGDFPFLRLGILYENRGEIRDWKHAREVGSRKKISRLWDWTKFLVGITGLKNSSGDPYDTHKTCQSLTWGGIDGGRRIRRVTYYHMCNI